MCAKGEKATSPQAVSNGNSFDNIYKLYINKLTSIMNKQETTQEQRAQLIEKLRAEYNDLAGWVNKKAHFIAHSFAEFRPRKGFTCNKYLQTLY
jgi:hypothetical protein